MIKKFSAVILCVAVVFLLVSCSGNTSNSTTEPTTAQSTESTITDETQTNSIGKTLVLYFSRADENYGVGTIEKGNTEILAEYIADELGADTFKIERSTPYPTAYDECTEEAKEEQNNNARPELKADLDNFDEYDTIYFGVPVWWGDMPMAVYTFIESHNFNGKTIYPFITHAGSGLSGIPEKMQQACSGAEVKDGIAVLGTDAQNNTESAKQQINEWMNK